MESKLAALIDRLEAVVARAEAGGASAAPVQAALATAKAAAGPVNPMVRDWQNEVMPLAKTWNDAATALNIKQVSVVTEQFVQLVNL